MVQRIVDKNMMEIWEYVRREHINVRIITASILLLCAVLQTAISNCPYDHYSVKGQHSCIKCPRCPKGSGMNAECRSYLTYEPEKIPHCVACQDGLTFSEHESSSICDICAEPCSEIDTNQNETRSCIKFHNRLCECKRGYFKHGATGICNQQCCPCNQKINIHQNKCYNDKMPNGRFCEPTRDDGKCDESTTKAPISASTETPSNVGKASSNLYIAVTVAPIVAVILLVCGSIYCYKRNCSGSRESIEDGGSCLIARQLYEKGSHGSRVLIRQLSRQRSGGSETHPCQQDFEEQLLYAPVGPFLNMLTFEERMRLAALLDKRETDNWLDIGLNIAGKNKSLADDIKKCHQSYYGGGEQMLEVINHLSMIKPEFTMNEFNSIANELSRTDVLSYISENNLLDSRFADIAYQHKVKIGDMLDKRVDTNSGHYWPSFADKFGCSNDQIQYFKMKIKEPQKYSPTYEMIMVLNTHKPELSIETFQHSAIAVNRPDVKKYLDNVPCRRLQNN